MIPIKSGYTHLNYCYLLTGIEWLGIYIVETQMDFLYHQSVLDLI